MKRARITTDHLAGSTRLDLRHPVELETEPLHFADVPFRPVCGSDHRGQRTTNIFANVTCDDCRRLVDRRQPHRSSLRVLYDTERQLAVRVLFERDSQLHDSLRTTRNVLHRERLRLGL